MKKCLIGIWILLLLSIGAGRPGLSDAEKKAIRASEEIEIQYAVTDGCLACEGWFTGIEGERTSISMAIQYESAKLGWANFHVMAHSSLRGGRQAAVMEETPLDPAKKYRIVMAKKDAASGETLAERIACVEV